jgi:pilus assembly protein CpaB
MGRLRGFLWFAAGLTVAVLAGFVAFITLSRAAAQGTNQDVSMPDVRVVAAAQAIAVRSTLTAESLELRELPVEAVPEGAVRELEEAAGKITLVDLYPGEVILAQRLVDPNVIAADGRSALAVTDEEVLMAFPAQDLMTRVGVLKPGDHVDLLFSLDFPVNRGLAALLGPAEMGEGEGAAAGREEQQGTVKLLQTEEQATFNLLQNITISAIVAGRTSTGGSEMLAPEAILLTVAPQDALILKYVKDAGGIPDIVLRAPGAEQPFSVEPVDVDYMIHTYQIPTEVGR